MLKRLYISNFRCLVNFELLLDQTPSALLLGNNGSGKSSVGRSLRVLQQIARGTNRVKELVGPWDVTRWITDAPIRLEIEVSLSRRYRYSIAFDRPTDSKNLRVIEESLTVDGLFLYSRDLGQVRLATTNGERDAGFMLDWHLVALPVIQEQSNSDPLHEFKTWLARMVVIAPYPPNMTGESEGDTLYPNFEMSNYGEWFTGLLAHSPSSYTDIDRFVKGLMPDLVDIKNPMVGPDTRSLAVQFGDGRVGDIGLRFRDLSDGEKCFLVCAALLAANKAYGPLFCYWDEPDNHLAMSEVGHFISEIRSAFQQGGQFLATSHNEETIRRFSDENTFVLGRTGHREPTQVRRLDDLGVTGDLIGRLIQGDLF